MISHRAGDSNSTNTHIKYCLCVYDGSHDCTNQLSLGCVVHCREHDDTACPPLWTAMSACVLGGLCSSREALPPLSVCGTTQNQARELTQCKTRHGATTCWKGMPAWGEWLVLLFTVMSDHATVIIFSIIFTKKYDLSPS